MHIATLRGGGLAVIRGGQAIPLESGSPRETSMSMRELIGRYDEFAPSLARVERINGAEANGSAELDAPIRDPSKIWAAASNYQRGTAAPGEGRGRGDKPALSGEQILEMAFLKPPSAIVGPGEAIVIPRGAQTIFPELELCAVIGRTCRNASAAEALDFVFGYTIILDVTARGYGAGVDGRATRCVRKGFDSFAPLGPWITTRDEISDPQELWMRLWVNDELRQSATTGAMINDVATLVSYLSGVGTLEPGDLIATGNPDSPEYQHQLTDGDTIRAEIEGIGSMELSVAREE